MKIMRFIFFTALVLLPFLFVSRASAGEFPIPKVDYSADMVMTGESDSEGESLVVKGKVFSTKDKERREMDVSGQKSIMITRRDKQVVWILMLNEKMYIENPMDKMENDPVRMMKEGQIKLTKLGKEKVNGEFEITQGAKGAQATNVVPL